MKGKEKNEYICGGNRRGGLSGITEFGDEKKEEKRSGWRVK